MYRQQQVLMNLDVHATQPCRLLCCRLGIGCQQNSSNFIMHHRSYSTVIVCMYLCMDRSMYQHGQIDRYKLTCLRTYLSPTYLFTHRCFVLFPTRDTCVTSYASYISLLSDSDMDSDDGDLLCEV